MLHKSDSTTSYICGRRETSVRNLLDMSTVRGEQVDDMSDGICDRNQVARRKCMSIL